MMKIKSKKIKSMKFDRKLREVRFSAGQQQKFEEELMENIQKSNKIKGILRKLDNKYNQFILDIKELSNEQFQLNKSFIKTRLDYFKKRMDRFRTISEQLKKERRSRAINKQEEFTIEVASEMSKLFTYQQVIEASSSTGKRGIELYGYLEINYPDKWEELLKSGIFDKMAYFSQKNFRPEVLKVMSLIDIKNYVQSPVLFSEEIRLKSVPDRPFKRAVFYAEKPLREYVKWINNYILYIDGYKTKVVLGKVNLILLGWALPDFPQILISYSPSQNKAIFEAQIRSEDLKEDTLDLLKKIVFYYRKENKHNEMKLIEALIERDRFEKRWSNLLDSIEYEKNDDPQQITKQPKVIYSTNPMFYIVLTIMGAVLILLIIFLFLK